MQVGGVLACTVASQSGRWAQAGRPRAGNRLVVCRGRGRGGGRGRDSQRGRLGCPACYAPGVADISPYAGDVLGLYSDGSAEGSYRDQGAVDIVTKHNARANSG